MDRIKGIRLSIPKISQTTARNETINDNFPIVFFKKSPFFLDISQTVLTITDLRQIK